MNTEGSFDCKCNDGYDGDGRKCEGKIVELFCEFKGLGFSLHEFNQEICNLLVQFSNKKVINLSILR